MIPITVVEGGDVAFNAMFYGNSFANPQNLQYFQNQISSFANTLTDTGRQFMEGARAIYDRYTNSDVLQIARTVLRNSDSELHQDLIRALNTLDELRSAQPQMQRWMMAMPELRDLHNAQRCDGFADTYTPIFKGQKSGESDYDYRRVMNGIFDENGCYTQYFEQLVETDRELEHDEQVIIIRTWDIARAFIKANEDVTNKYGGKL